MGRGWVSSWTRMRLADVPTACPARAWRARFAAWPIASSALFDQCHPPRDAAVDVERLAGDEARLLAGEEDDRRRDVVGVAHAAHRRAADVPLLVVVELGVALDDDRA